MATGGAGRLGCPAAKPLKSQRSVGVGRRILAVGVFCVAQSWALHKWFFVGMNFPETSFPEDLTLMFSEPTTPSNFHVLPFLPLQVDSSTRSLIQNAGVLEVSSDSTYLSHCNLQDINFTEFLEFRNRLLNVTDFRHLAASHNVSYTDVTDDIILQGFELFARGAGMCDFSLYHPTVPFTTPGQIESVSSWASKIPAPPLGEARIVYCISAFDDIKQLEALIDAINLPQHLIVIHLERQTRDTNFTDSMKTLAQKYDRNLVVVQFGSVVYTSDYLSQIFLQIMRFVTMDLKLEYDYLITLGSSSFPLWNARDLAIKLKSEPPYVRIGRLIATDRLARDLCRMHSKSIGIVLSRAIKLRVFTKRDTKLQRSVFDDQATQDRLAPSNLGLCRRKTNSGNTAAFDRAAVQSLLESPDAMSFLSRFKHSAECCNEEFSWGVALHIIGRQDDIEKPGAIWQGWSCWKSMGNSVLKRNLACMYLADMAALTGKERAHNVNSSTMEIELKAAQKRGHLFARKFSSSDKFWQEWIRANLHQIK